MSVGDQRYFHRQRGLANKIQGVSVSDQRYFHRQRGLANKIQDDSISVRMDVHHGCHNIWAGNGL